MIAVEIIHVRERRGFHGLARFSRRRFRP